ncbi:hypothetical protein BDR26DRAFT_631442 [Obelidium mucronatum]|nr:hypothetical protein BDR26DRAFT_631442 [Obelidium mucronatum]
MDQESVSSTTSSGTKTTRKPKYIRKDPEKRLLQNRESQKASRERKKLQIESLEKKISELMMSSGSKEGFDNRDEIINQLRVENMLLKDSVRSLEQSGSELRQELISSRLHTIQSSRNENNQSQIERIIELQSQQLSHQRLHGIHPIPFDQNVISAIDLFGPMNMRDLEQSWKSICILENDVIDSLACLTHIYSTSSVSSMRHTTLKHSLLRTKIIDSLSIVERSLYLEAQERFFARYPQHNEYAFALGTKFKSQKPIPSDSLRPDSRVRTH